MRLASRPLPTLNEFLGSDHFYRCSVTKFMMQTRKYSSQPSSCPWREESRYTQKKGSPPMSPIRDRMKRNAKEQLLSDSGAGGEFWFLIFKKSPNVSSFSHIKTNVFITL